MWIEFDGVFWDLVGYCMLHYLMFEESNKKQNKQPEIL